MFIRLSEQKCGLNESKIKTELNQSNYMNMGDKENKTEQLKVRLTKNEKAIVTDEFRKMAISPTQFFRQTFLPLLIEQNKQRKNK